MIKGISKKTKIVLLKRELRRAYTDYMNLLGEFSCGANLAEVISSRVSDAKNKVNSLLDQLALIDPKCPKTRY